ncbi:AAA family ATPase [Actinoplanes sp. TBRC 11911]|uniref:AAA family ATPase n=1 Tax=Actinoplanes sp. TBRC 11911 TaxID=2729386 RepID=UPI00145FA063|nr:AAA family ATPase [Actinoplanes sp. TBRC 11911]NMO55597.1 AAA family ATPase [Actinoplanes sp. TBRC 11911]
MTPPEAIEPADWLAAARLHAETSRSKALVPVAATRADQAERENGELVSRISLSELATTSQVTRDQVRTVNIELARAGLTVELTAPTGRAPAAVGLRIPSDLATQVSLADRKTQPTAFTSEIVLTEEQRRAVNGIVDVGTQRPKITGLTRVLRVHGYAGTGKTTVIAAALRELEAAGKSCAVVGPTGKAAHVLRQKGLAATTAHSALYQPRGESDDGSPEFSVNLDAAITAVDVVIIDECSMVSEQMADHFAYNVRAVVAVGDPMQLPPVNSDGAPWAVRGECEYELTEVLRSDAAEVLDLAHRLRSGTWDRAAVYGHPTHASGLVNPHDYDAIIVYKNADRWSLIEQMRGGRVLVVVDLDDLERIMGSSQAAQWLYTAITRARHQVTIAALGQVSGLA